MNSYYIETVTANTDTSNFTFYLTASGSLNVVAKAATSTYFTCYVEFNGEQYAKKYVVVLSRLQ